MHSLIPFFDWLVTASLRASVLMVGVCLVQFVLQKHLSPRWRYALWLPVLIVLLMPIQPESRWSVASVMEWNAQVMETSSLPVVTDAVPSSVPSLLPLPTEHSRAFDWQKMQVLSWAAGAILVLLFGAVSFARTLIRFRRTRLCISDQLTASLDEVTREVGLRRKPRVLISPSIQSPAVTGLLRPLLLLPADFDREFTTEEKHLVLQHELMHLKRGDLPLNTLLCVLIALHWFNPLLWLAFLKARADREAACDAQVLENATPQRRSAYGHALLKLESNFAPLRLSLSFIGILQKHASLRARIQSIAAPTRTKPLTGILATTCMLTMTFLGVTRAEKPAKEEEFVFTSKKHHLEILLIEFDQESDWRFGNRLGAPPAKLSDSDEGQFLKQEVVSQQERAMLVAETLKQKGARKTVNPKMVVEDGGKASIRSVVNQPVISESKQDGNTAEAAIEYLSIGFIGNFMIKTLANDNLRLDIDITNTRIIGETMVNGNPYPIVSSQVIQAPIELAAGMSALFYGWKDEWKNGKRQKPRPVLYVLTPSEAKTDTSPENKTPRSKTTSGKKPVATPVITANKAAFDQQKKLSRYIGDAKLEMPQGKEGKMTASASEIVHLQAEDVIVLKAPWELVANSTRMSSQHDNCEARIYLKPWKFEFHGGSVKTERINATPSPEETLRSAKPKAYEFKKIPPSSCSSPFGRRSRIEPCRRSSR
ncbi:MAG: hypothetical protein IPK32_10635 [Verrucomicrobiaceae bacterium]|nr:hypothetical protein [Verrucomicrobiaceae bacterium]